MKPKFRTINMYQGQTFKDQFLFVDGDNLPIDLSAKTARMQVREAIDSPVIFELVTGAGITLGADGLLTFDMSAADTAALAIGQYDPQQWVYDLEITTPGSPDLVDRVLTGVVTFSPEITRD